MFNWRFWFHFFCWSCCLWWLCRCRWWTVQPSLFNRTWRWPGGIVSCGSKLTMYFALQYSCICTSGKTCMYSCVWEHNRSANLIFCLFFDLAIYIWFWLCYIYVELQVFITKSIKNNRSFAVSILEAHGHGKSHANLPEVPFFAEGLLQAYIKTFAEGHTRTHGTVVTGGATVRATVTVFRPSPLYFCRELSDRKSVV